MTHTSMVLVIEDDPYISKLVAMLLEEANYQSLIAKYKLDLVILDWMLPDLPGDQVCRLIKARSATTFFPVLMLTARGELADRIAGLDAGADDYLTKPFHSD